MTEKELKAKLSELSKEEDAELKKEETNGTLVGLDGSISSKYREKRKALFDEYEKNKE